MRTKLIAILLLTAPGLSLAQIDRTDTWEWSIAGIYQDSADSGAAGGSSVDVDSAFGLGVNLSYNFSNRLSVGADFEWLRPDYTATIISDDVPPQQSTINYEFSQFNGRFKGTLNFLEGPLTPYVEAGLGWTYIDSNVADGPPVTGCWWNPWWGYICDNFYSTYSDTSFTYGGALGLRYQMRGGVVMKLSLNHYILDFGSGKPDPSLDAARLEFGWAF